MKTLNTPAVIGAIITAAASLIVGFGVGKKAALSVEQTVTVDLPDQGSESLTLGEAADRIERLAREAAIAGARLESLQGELSSCRRQLSQTSGAGGVLDSPVGPSPDPPDGSEVIASSRTKDVLFELHNCRMRDSRVTCSFTVTNKGADREISLFAAAGRWTTTLYDDRGGEFGATEARLGEYTDARRATKMLIRDIPIAASFTFNGVSEEASKIAVLSVGFAHRFAEYTFKLRDLPLVM